MRSGAITAMALTIALVLFFRYSEAVVLRGFLPEDDEDFRPRPVYRDYGSIRNRAIRRDDAFDDYGHLRFGRSED